MVGKQKQPTLAEDIIQAVVALNEPAGSTQPCILKYLKDNSKANAKTLGAELKRMTGKGQLVKTKNTFQLAAPIKKDLDNIKAKGETTLVAATQVAVKVKKTAAVARKGKQAAKKAGKKAAKKAPASPKKTPASPKPAPASPKAPKSPKAKPASPKAASPKAVSPKSASPKQAELDSFPAAKKVKTPKKVAKPKKAAKKPAKKAAKKPAKALAKKGVSGRSKGISRKK